MTPWPQILDFPTGFLSHSPPPPQFEGSHFESSFLPPIGPAAFVFGPFVKSPFRVDLLRTKEGWKAFSLALSHSLSRFKTTVIQRHFTPTICRLMSPITQDCQDKSNTDPSDIFIYFERCYNVSRISISEKKFQFFKFLFHEGQQGYFTICRPWHHTKALFVGVLGRTPFWVFRWPPSQSSNKFTQKVDFLLMCVPTTTLESSYRL